MKYFVVFIALVLSVCGQTERLTIKTPGYSYIDYRKVELSPEGVMINEEFGTLGANQPQTYVKEWDMVPGAGNRFQFYITQVKAIKQGASFIADEGSEETVLVIDEVPEGLMKHEFTAFNDQPLPDVKKTVWTLDDADMNGDLFREGTDKVVGGLVDLLEKKTEAGMTKDEFQSTATDQISQQVQSVIDDPITAVGTGGPVAEEALAQSDAAVDAVQELLQKPAASVVYSASGDGSWLVVQFPVEFGGRQFDMNPFRSDRMGDVAFWFRTATEWLAFILLGYWVFTQFGEWLKAYSATRQASGNPVIGGTGAQATALLNAGLMTAAVVVAVTSLVAWGFNSINIESLFLNSLSNPLATMASNSYWFLDQLFPVGVLLTCLTARLMFALYANAVFGTFFTVVRFFVT